MAIEDVVVTEDEGVEGAVEAPQVTGVETEAPSEGLIEAHSGEVIEAPSGEVTEVEEVEGVVDLPENKEGKNNHKDIDEAQADGYWVFRRVFMPGVPATVDARLTDNSQDALVASFRSIRLRDDDLPSRPDFGTRGVQIKLRCNFFPVKVPKGPLYEYDVSMSPAVSIKRLKRKIFASAEKTTDWKNAGMLGKVAHDHSSKLISSFQLPQPLTIKVPLIDEDDEPKKKKDNKEYTLTIKHIQAINTGDLVKYVPFRLYCSLLFPRDSQIWRCYCICESLAHNGRTSAVLANLRSLHPMLMEMILMDYSPKLSQWPARAAEVRCLARDIRLELDSLCSSYKIRGIWRYGW